MSSKRRLRRKACGKVRYASTQDAQAAIRHAYRRGEKVHPYPCPHCGGVHIGHKTGKQKQAEASRRRQAWRTA